MTAGEVQGILRTIGLKPQQAAGQNFLLDEHVAEAMVDAAGIVEGQKVLEIGPGLGILTQALHNRGANVIAVELDSRLYPYVKKKFAAQDTVRIIHDDIFKVNLNEIFKDGEYALVANLPYSATSLVFRNFLTLTPRPTSLTVMIQREVAQRICAQPGDMSMLALTVQYYCQPALLFDVPPSKFFPTPKVTSSILHCSDLRSVDNTVDKALFRLMRAGFSSRRKKLSNSLSSSLSIPTAQIEEKMAKISLSLDSRAQELTIEQWQELEKKISLRSTT